MPFGISYYIYPLVSAVVWTGTLLGLLIYWLVDGRPLLPSMTPQTGQTIAYISDVGAGLLKPLFIAGSAVTVVSFDLVFINDQWLRYRGRLAPTTSKSEKILGVLCIISSIAGGAGLVLLSVFDTLNYPRLHRAFLGLFIVGYLLTAIFVCAQYQRLGKHQRQYRILRGSFWLKLTWCLLFFALAIAFVVTQTIDMWNTAAIIEWTIGFLFAVFVATFAVDFFPAVSTKSKDARFPTMGQMEKGRVAGSHHMSPGYTHNSSFESNQPVPHANGHHHQIPPTAHTASRNF